MNMNAPKGRISQLVDKVDILRAQIASMKALASEVGTNPDEAARPYVDMLLDLLDAELADALSECRPARVVIGQPMVDGELDSESVDIEGTMRSCDLDGRRFILRDDDRTMIFHFVESIEADVAASVGKRVRVRCRAISVDVPRTIYAAESITPM